MATVVWSHCDGMKLLENVRPHIYPIGVIMIYSDNIIAQQFTSYVISDTNKWSHSYAGKKEKKMTKKQTKRVTVIRHHCDRRKKITVTI